MDFSNASQDVQNVNTLLQKLLDKFYPNIKSLIPIMTSNNTPSGICSSSSTQSQSNPHRAFDGDDNTGWRPYAGTNDNSSNTDYVQYRFANKVSISKVEWLEMPNNCTSGVDHKTIISVSTDGSSFKNIINKSMSSQETTIRQTVDFEEPIDALYIRFTTDKRNVMAGQYYNVYLAELQAYGVVVG